MNQKNVSNITYGPTDEGCLFVANIMNFHGRVFLGTSMNDPIFMDLVYQVMHKAKGYVGKVDGYST